MPFGVPRTQKEREERHRRLYGGRPPTMRRGRLSRTVSRGTSLPGFSCQIQADTAQDWVRVRGVTRPPLPTWVFMDPLPEYEGKVRRVNGQYKEVILRGGIKFVGLSGRWEVTWRNVPEAEYEVKAIVNPVPLPLLPPPAESNKVLVEVY